MHAISQKIYINLEVGIKFSIRVKAFALWNTGHKIVLLSGYVIPLRKIIYG